MLFKRFETFRKLDGFVQMLPASKHGARGRSDEHYAARTCHYCKHSNCCVCWAQRG